ncbi:Noc2p family-domain-containing protein [Pyronema domesticum]|uniref:Similar to Nucleolar complex protein 2 acc. no. P39744 n=1 Tax=Pyronema omphalodes (strain CBS 100304) TaxID=1076935 RepID=U4LGT0_PYROM|nr:Noc2p family-domain-containing protein [Pyronema domesticum]CCX30737.1 Similar to Nucleolar complex protein 2; acc. no. P39744 [Pyronema omphalodes CBS 100304]
MGRVKKSTRKFEAKHLTRTLDDRKAKKKTKQAYILREKKKAKRVSERAGEEGSEEEEDEAKIKAKQIKKDGPQLFEDMSVEQFFAGGFEVPEAAPSKDKKRKRDEKESKKETAEVEENAEDSADEFDEHKNDLSKLAENDPEFYKYLKENDPELLDFTMAERDDLSSIDELSEGEEEEETDKKSKKGKKEKDSNDVSMEDVKKWKTALVENKSLRSLREVVLAFRAAAHVNDVEVDAKQGGFKYTITNPNVYHELLVIALKHIPEVLQHHLPIKESASGKVRVATDSKKYRTLTPLLKSHSQSLMHLLPLLTDAASQKLLLNSVLELVPYFLNFRKFLKTFLKTIVEIWGTNSTDEAARITAFLVIRRTAVIGDEGIKETSLKALYAGLVKASRQTTAHTIQGINLMKNSAAEIVGLPGFDKVGYQAGFGYIRQLAVHLRQSITNNSKESYKTVYNWQYVHSLDFWSRVLAMHCDGLKEAQAGKESPLRPLIYPLVQVTLGAIRLIPTASYFPLRFFLIRSLLRLSLSTGVYIPIAPLIFEVLASAELKKKPKPATLKPIDFSITIRAAKSYLSTRVYIDGVAEQIVELFSEFYVLYSKSVAFPELAIPTIVMIKRFMKKNKNTKFNTQLHLLVQKLEANSKFIQEKRANLDFAPGRKAEVERFLKDMDWESTPLGAYVVSQRKVREEKRRMLEEALKEEERKRKENKAEDSDDVVMSSDGEEEDEDDDEDLDLGDESEDDD